MAKWSNVPISDNQRPSKASMTKQRLFFEHTDSNELWSYKHKKIKLYNKEYEVTQTMDLDFEIYDMSLTSSQDIIATDYNNHNLVRISPSGGISLLCSTGRLTPSGICINDKEEIVVGLLADWGAYPMKLAVYSPDGSEVLQEIETGGGKELFTRAINRVKQTTNGDYVVCMGDEVVCVSKEGKFRWEYRVRGWAFGLECDRCGNIIIADFEYNEIGLLSGQGRLIATLLTGKDGIEDPWFLSVDGHGYLWIGQKDNIKVVKYLIAN